MKTAIIIHGMPSKEEYCMKDGGKSPSNRHWFPWLQCQLLIKGILTQTPEIPEPYEPVYEKWKKVFEQFPIDEETILVGHSCGGGFLVRWLSENKVRVGKVVLAAPWLDLEKELSSGMFDFDIDPEFPSRTAGVTIVYSTDDDDYILGSVAAIKRGAHGVEEVVFTDKGHLTRGDMRSDEFPELLDIIL